MGPRSSRNERKNLHTDVSRRYDAPSSDRERPRHVRNEKEPTSFHRRSDERRIIWDNDLYERQSL